MTHYRYHEREWRYDADSREVVISNGVRIPVCSEHRPRIGAAPVSRRGEAEWQIAPCRFDGLFFKKQTDEEFIMLVGAPSHLELV